MSGILTLIYATHSGILTSPRSSKPHDLPSSPEERSPTMPRYGYLYIHGFGDRLKPRYIFRAGSLDQ